MLFYRNISTLCDRHDNSDCEMQYTDWKNFCEKLDFPVGFLSLTFVNIDKKL